MEKDRQKLLVMEVFRSWKEKNIPVYWADQVMIYGYANQLKNWNLEQKLWFSFFFFRLLRLHVFRKQPG
jgi:hypothetical protein